MSFTEDQLVELNAHLTDYQRHMEAVLEDAKEQKGERQDPDGCRLCGEQDQAFLDKKIAEGWSVVRSVGTLRGVIEARLVESGGAR